MNGWSSYTEAKEMTQEYFDVEIDRQNRTLVVRDFTETPEGGSGEPVGRITFDALAKKLREGWK